MKGMKKLASLLLVIVMVFSMTITAFAKEGTNAGTKGKITIDNAVEGETYTIYQIFKLESFNDSTPEVEPDADGAYAYTIAKDSPWYAFVTTGFGNEFVKVDERGYVTWVEGKSAADFASAAITYIKEVNSDNIDNNNISNAGSKVAEKDAEKVKDVVFTDLSLGYYLLDSSLGTLCSLNTTNPDVTIREKNEVPSIDKDVKEVEWKDETDGKDNNNENDANIGDTVEFRVTIKIPSVTLDGNIPEKVENSDYAGAQNYVLHDKMADGLTFNPTSISITIGDKEVSEFNYAIKVADKLDTDSKYVTPEDSECTFEIHFKDEFLNSLTDSTEVVVTYTAVVNENAVIADKGNKNSAQLTYGDESYTEWSETVTYVWEFGVFKYTNHPNNKKTPLTNAVFSLYKSEGTDENSKAVYSDPVNLVITDTANTYRVCTKAECDHKDDEDKSTHLTEITTTETGSFKIEGLDAATYYLVEEKAPNGYNVLRKPVKVTIDHEGSLTAVYEETVNSETVGGSNNVIEVENHSGVELPSTGGMGTTIFYILGAILVIGAAILLITRKRMSNEQ